MGRTVDVAVSTSTDVAMGSGARPGRTKRPSSGGYRGAPIGAATMASTAQKQQQLATDKNTRWKSSMITGASRGIGLEMVKQLLERGGSVVAACRRPSSAPDVGERLMIVEMDVTSEASVSRAAEEVASRHQRLDLVINAVGILHDSNMMPETALNKVSAESMLINYQTNAMGPLLVAKYFTDLLSARPKDMSDGIGVLASISARVGSISDNKLGGWYSYRASKAALNMLMTNVALENVRRKRPFACILLHPGTVDTDLSKPFQRNVPEGKLFTRDQSVAYLLGVVDGVEMADNGKFIAWDAKEIAF